MPDTTPELREATKAAVADAINWIPTRVVAHLDDKLRHPTIEEHAAALDQVREHLKTVQVTATWADETPEQPFDPGAAARMQARLDAYHQAIADGYTEEHALELASYQDPGDVTEVLRQRAYAKDEAALLAEKCAAWRSKYEETRARLEAVRSVVNEWHAYATETGPADLDLAPIAGHVLKQILRALDGDPEGV